MDLKPGTRVKNYTLERQLGRGASGEVWKAYDDTKTVAIKFMNENLMTSASAAKHRERLIREVEALRRLQHPNIPTLYDYDLDFVRPYLAMRYVGGDSYDRLISNGEMLRIPLERRLEMVRDIAFALTAAHEAGIVHRDIKPANLTGIENPYLLDFSISLENDEAEHTQRFVGTTLYMSADGVADRLSDNYSFAVVVYEMIFGRHPIYQLGDSVFNQFIADMRIRNRQWTFPSMIPPAQRPADLKQADLRRLDAIFERAIGPREQRYVDLREFVRDLRTAVMPHTASVEEPLIGHSVVPQHLSQVPQVPPPPRHVSQPPVVPASQPAAPPSAPPPAPESVSPEESNFLEKAFVNLPAIKPADVNPPEPKAEEPPVVLEQTQLEHGTVPWDYEKKQRVPVDEKKKAEEAKAPVIQPYQPSAETPAAAGPDDMTMMEIRIPPAAEPKAAPPPAEPPAPQPAPAQPAAEMAGPDDMTMMEIRLPERSAEPPPAPSAPPASSAPPPRTPETPPVRPPEPSSPPVNLSRTEVEEHPALLSLRLPRQEAPVNDTDRTVPDIPVPPRAAPPAAVDDNRTMLDMPAPRPPAPAQQNESFTLMEMQTPRQPAGREENFTLLQAASGSNQQADENFTLMEMQSPGRASVQSPGYGENFTLLEVNAVGKTPQGGTPQGKNRTRLIVVVAVVILVLVALAVVVLLAMNGASPA